MLQPSLHEVLRRANEGTTIPVFLELLADMDTPVSAYTKLEAGPGAFLLESVEGGEQLGRYSFLGLHPDFTLTLHDGEARIHADAATIAIPSPDPLETVQSLLCRERPIPVAGLPRFHGGAVGYLAYDLAHSFERIPPPRGRSLDIPLGILSWYRTVVAFDHLRRTIKVITHVPTTGDILGAYRDAERELEILADRLSRPLDPGDGRGATQIHASAASMRFQSNQTREQFEEAVRRAKEYILAGDVLQVVLSQRLTTPTGSTGLAIYRALRAINPSPYMYLLDFGDLQVVGASPEMLVRVEDGTVSVHPIAGTRPRGRTPDEDARLAEELARDEKERAEHFMLVDLGRNDIGRVSEPGTVRVSRLLDVERYSHVMHLVSHVEGRLRRDLRAVDALRACFPAGTVSGAPKIRAMEIISELEPDARGIYAGAVGYIGFDGNLDTAIAIRTVVLHQGMAHIQAGAGVVADSVPEIEYQETMNKAAALLRAVASAEAIGGWQRATEAGEAIAHGTPMGG